MRQAYSKQMDGIEDYFNKLDAEFIGIRKIEDETYSYRATDLLVQTAWELPIVIQWPKALVNYEFNSSPGDISFGVVFVAAPEEGEEVDDLDMETVEEMDRVPSNSETISGSFELPCEGVVFFLWDNNYDWSAVKNISYKIDVKEPSFSLVDQFRSESSIKSMRQLTEELDIQYSRLADAQDCIQNNTANVKFLEDQIDALQRKLQTRKSDYQKVQTSIMDCYAVVHISKESKLGLCIRTLEGPILSYLLSFLNESQLWPTVCRHWYDVFSSKATIYSTSRRWYSHLTKSDIKEMKESIKNNFRTSTNVSGTAQEIVDVGEPLEDHSLSSAESDRVIEMKAKSLALRQKAFQKNELVSPNCHSPSENMPVEGLTESLKSSKGRRKEEKLLQDVRNIRNEQQQLAMIEYINNNYSKMKSLLVEKRRVKRLIKAWNTSYEKEHGRLPSSTDRKGHLRELHEEYQQVSLAIRIREEKIDKTLKQMGLSRDQFEELRNSKYGDW